MRQHRGSKRAADAPHDDPRASNTDQAKTQSPRREKISAGFPHGPRLTGDGLEYEIAQDAGLSASVAPPPSTDSLHVSDTAEQRYRLRCATCKCEFKSRSSLHKHIRKLGHQKIDDGSTPPGLVDSSDDETEGTSSPQQRRALAQMIRRALIDHFRFVAKPDLCDIVNPIGSVAGLPSRR